MRESEIENKLPGQGLEKHLGPQISAKRRNRLGRVVKGFGQDQEGIVRREA